MNTSANNQYDAIESLFFQEGIGIIALDIHPELDLLTIYLNTKAVLSQRISSHKLLKDAEETHLLNYELIADGLGVH